ncbi:phosphotransferase [Peredibacter sp. HCB2-198]|uniref:phosphotransferase n=1 Tax=Peredibacter sp. HCB2-198 TaxID=3383025 RepID=UPI0038B5ECFF
MEYDPSAPESTFIFHPLYRVGVSEHSFENIEKTFGKSFFGRFRHNIGNLKKVDWLLYARKKFVARLPSDSIIFFRSDKEGVIIVSHEKNIALKMFFDESHILNLDEEIKSLKGFETTSFAPYVAKILGEGTTSNGGRWLVTTYCSNSWAITNRAHHEKFLLRYFPLFVMPPLTELYKSHGPRKITVETWIREAHERSLNHPARKEIEKTLKKITKLAAQNPGYEVLESRIHHDLHAGNILLDDNQIIIIDWELEVRGLVLVDILDFARRYLQRNFFTRMAFQFYLKGLFREPPKLILKNLSSYRNWALVNFKMNVPIGSEKLTFLVYAIERSLIYFEKRQLNRLKDRKGFERRIVKWS